LNQRAQYDSTAWAEGYLPGPVLLLGAPGVGKGTQAKILMQQFHIPQISTGDLLRDHRKRHTELGLLADELMQRGELVPDDLVNRMVAERLASFDCQPGFILDGYPRTLVQADWMDKTLASGELNAGGKLPLVAISILVNHDALLKRITGRRISATGRIYNIYTNPPRVAGVDDIDGSALTQRSDDTETAFEQRMREFHAKTAAVIDHYRACGRFLEVDGSASVEHVTAAIREGIFTLRQQPVALAGSL